MLQMQRARDPQMPAEESFPHLTQYIRAMDPMQMHVLHLPMHNWTPLPIDHKTSIRDKELTQYLIPAMSYK